MDVDKADLGINFEKYILIYYIYIRKGALNMSAYEIRKCSAPLESTFPYCTM